MFALAEKRLSRLINQGNDRLLRAGVIGLEKEALRVSLQGSIAQTPHPCALGSALTHPYITTDYSEALIECVTPPFGSVFDSLSFLGDAQKFVYDNLAEEVLWVTSMPCILEGAHTIPIAQYGPSNAGMMKTVYRRGLGHRYGRAMQVIAGVHFNYSLSQDFWNAFQDLEGDRRETQAFISESYVSLVRNLSRLGWLVPYLFGASPAVCKSYFSGTPTSLQEFDESTYYLPYATSLRMGDIGYQNSEEQGTGARVCYDDLRSYIRSLTRAIETPCPKYEQIGVVVDGHYKQLNANILQIENEYYSTVRLKQVPLRDEKPSLALKRREVRYIELRSLDVNAYDPLGINEDQLRFLETLVILCLLMESPLIDDQERREIDANQLAIANRGRYPSLRLQSNGQGVGLREWAMEILDTMQSVCNILDAGLDKRPYTAALAKQRERVLDPDRTPSARMLAEMRENGESFHYFAKRMSFKHQRFFRSFELSEEQRRFLIATVKTSLQRQRDIEVADDISFGEYLARYFAQ